MEHPFFPTTTTRAEALRWLTISEKLLSGRDLMGSKSFASRARDADPTLTPANQLLAVVDTLLAGDTRIGNNQQDFYAILGLTLQQGRDAELIASQYRTLALLLNPQKNKFPFAEQAFRLVLDAWSVLSDPARKALYDKELNFYLHPQQQQSDPFGNPIPALHQNFIFFGGGSSSGGVTHPSQPHAPPVHFSQVQVHASPPVDPMAGGSSREPQNFMNFSSSSNIVFGSGIRSGAKPDNETVNKQTQESYFTFAGNVTATPVATQGQGNNEHEPPSPDNNEHKQPQSQSQSQSQSQPQPQTQPQHSYFSFGDKTSHNVNVSENAEERTEDEEEMEGMEEPEERNNEPAFDDSSTFWTACPYCYYMYEYPRVYADCTLRCQNCKKAFQAVIIPSPPPIVDGQEGYFCCWGFFPLGFSMENWEKNKGAASTWTPFSDMFTCPQPVNAGNATKSGKRRSSAPRIYFDDDDDDVFVELLDTSGSDDDDWSKDVEKRRKKTKNLRKGASGAPSRNAKEVQEGKDLNVQDGLVSPPGVEPADKTAGESSKRANAICARKQPSRVVKNAGKLDLNVEFSNEAEEPASRVNRGNGPSTGEDDNIEGIGFFEGLDEFLSSLPILNVVGDDKVVKAA